MKKRFPVLFISCFLFLGQMVFAGGPTGKKGEGPEKIKGVSVTSPRDEVAPEVMNEIVEINANWITLLPFGYSQQNKPKVSYNTMFHWWGSRFEGMTQLIRAAKERGMKVMIKPQVWIPDSWPGGFALDSEENWQEWERQYEAYILDYAKIAEKEGVEMFCIGTEFKTAIKERPKFWGGLIREVRKVYSGDLTYAANWDSFYDIPFWGDLDYIGVDAYFPLTSVDTPAVADLKRKWKDPKYAIQIVQRKYKKPVIFTEYGYKSIQKTAWKQWEFENTPTDQYVNLVAQENAYQAIYDMFWDEPWFAGGFIWKWYVHEDHPGGKDNSDYTPQNKPALELIRRVYGEESK